MGDVSLGSVKAKLELDASAIDSSVKQATDALKTVGASAEQAGQYLEALMKVPAENGKDFNEPLLEAAKTLDIVGASATGLKDHMPELASGFSEAAEGAAGFAGNLAHVSSTLARAGESFDLPISGLREIAHVSHVAELGLDGVGTAAVGLNMATLGVVGAGLAFGSLIGHWIGDIEAVKEKTTEWAKSLYDVAANMGLVEKVNVGALAGIKDFSAAMGASHNEALQKQVASLKEQGVSLSDIAKLYKGQLTPAQEESLGISKEQVKTQKDADTASAHAAKQLQGEMDSLSGAKAQQEMDLIGAAVKRLGSDGVNDLAGLGKQVLDLSAKGAKIPALLDPAIQAYGMEIAKKGIPEAINKIYAEADKGAKQSTKGLLVELGIQADAYKTQQQQEQFWAKQTSDVEIEEARVTGKLRNDEYARQEAQVQERLSRRIQQITKAAASAEIPPDMLGPLIGKWEELAAKEMHAIEVARHYAEIQKSLSEVGTILGQLGGLFEALGGNADSMFGRIISGAQGAVSSIQGIVSSVQGFGLAAASGNVFGMISSGIGIAVGAVGAVKSIVGIFHKPEYKKIMGDVGKSWGTSISEGLAKEIEQIAKTSHVSRSLAELLDVSKIIGESGKDPREFTGKINDLMNAIKAGSVPAAQGLAELSKAFGMVADAALKSGNIGDKALVGLIKRARELGEVTPEMKDFISGQLNSAVEGVKKLVEVLPGDTAEKAGSSGALLAATFNAMAAEQGIVAASAALGPAYDQLMQQISKAGIAIPDALGSIGRQMELGKNPQFQAASSAAAATSQVLSGLGNAGYMDTAVLGASADVAKQTFDQAKAAGATDKEAYQSIGGLLSDIKNASIQSGQQLSGVAQELISGAQAQGVVIQGDQLSVLVDIRNILAGGGYSGGGGGGAGAGAGGGSGGSGPESGGYTGAGGGSGYADEGPSRGGWRGGEGYAEGSGGIKDFGAGTPVTLHGREAVLTEKQMGQMGGPSLQVNATFRGDPLQTHEARQDLSRFQIDQLLTALRNDPLMRKMIRDGGGR